MVDILRTIKSDCRIKQIGFTTALAVLSLFIVSSTSAQTSAGDTVKPSISWQFDSEEKAKEDSSRIMYGVSALMYSQSDDLNNGYGIRLSCFYEANSILLLSGSIAGAVSPMEIDGLPDGDFVTFAPELNVSLTGKTGRLRPNIGVGIGFHLNHLYFDEASAISISGYDSTTQSEHVSMGYGFVPHVSMGLFIGISKKIEIMLESRFTFRSYTAEIEYADQTDNRVWKGTIEYDAPVYWLYIGVRGFN